MRRSLLNKQILLKSLRQALVLFTLLILPSAAWGQGTIEIAGFDATNAEVMQNNYGSTVSFNSETNTLTLNNATILGAISTSIDGLVIELIGKNTITASDGPAILSTVISNNIVLSFKSTESTVGSLTAIPVGDKAIKGFEISYGNGLSLIPEEMVEGETVVVGKDYGLKLGNIYVSNANADNIFNATNPSNNQPTASYSNGVLTLNGVTLGTIDESNLQNSDFVSIVSELDALTINLIGENKLYGTITSNLNNATLAFTGDGSLEISGESSPITDFTNVDFGEFNLASKSAPGIHWEVDGQALRGYEDSARDVTITKASYYPIWVHGSTDIYATHTQLTEANTPISIGGGTISFDGEHTITVSTVNFNFESNTMIVVGPDMLELTINLIGDNSIRTGSQFLNLWDTTPLTFITNESEPGSLTAPTIVSWMSDNSQSQGGQISYDNGLVFNSKTIYNSETQTSTYTETISTTGVRIKIGKSGDPEEISGSTDENGLFGGTVFFDASNNTLTLKGATLGNIDSQYGIQVFVDDLKVVISGDNTIIKNIEYKGNNNLSSSIQINKAEGATSASLTLENINSFGACTWGEGLYLTGNTIAPHYEAIGAESCFNDYKESTASEVIFSTTVSYPLWVGGVQVTDDNKDGITGVTYTVGQGSYQSISGTVSFNPTGNILTLTDASVGSPLSDCEAPIISNLPNLEININKIDPYGGCQLQGYQNGFIDDGSGCAKSINTDATLVFSTNYTSSSEAESPTMQIDCYDPIASGFKSISTNNQIIYKRTSNYYWVQRIAQPTMSLVNGSLQLSDNNEIDLNYEANSAVTLKYKITDATGTAGEEKTYVATTAETINNPCTIDAWAVYQSQESELVTGKYFGIADKTIVFSSTTSGSELKASDFELSPATEGVSIAIINAYNSNVISYNAETGATIVGIGACNIDIKINANEGSNIQILNTPTINPDTPGAQTAYIITKEVTVLPDKPSIVKDAEHDYIETDKITITRTSVEGEVAENIKIFYIWSDDEVEVKTYQPYVDGGSVSIYSEPIAAQTGTLRAWVGYHAGDNYYYNSEVVSEEFTVYEIAEMEWESETQTYGTFYNPDKDMAVPTGSTAYIVTGISEDGTSVTISPVSYIKAGVAVLIERNKTTEVSKTTDFSASKMNYSNPNTPAQPSATDNWYVIYNNKFVKVTEGTQVKGGKCYLNLNSTPAGTRGFYNIGDGEGTTAIREVIYEGVNSEKLADGAWHDLQGRKFTTKPTKAGIYIRNGKKIVIK